MEYRMKVFFVSQLVESGINWDALANPLKELAVP